MNKLFLFTFIFFMAGFAGYCQDSASSESTIDAKFRELIENSNNFKGYKVVDTGELTTLQNLTSRRIAELKEEIAAAKEEAQAQEEKTEALQADLAALETQIAEVSAQKDAITFLGMPISKDTYKNIMWGTVGFLVLALALFVYRFKKSHLQTKEARQRLAETEKEFESFRAKALEKEQRMGRQLQDERNKALKVSP